MPHGDFSAMEAERVLALRAGALQADPEAKRLGDALTLARAKLLELEPQIKTIPGLEDALADWINAAADIMERRK